MKSHCLFREDVKSPIFESVYDFNTGQINNVPPTKFKYVLPDFFIREYDLPVNYGLSIPREYYILALQITNGLVAVNFYDVGVTVITKDSIVVLFFEGLSTKYYEDLNMFKGNIFNYNKSYVGVYKTVVIQLDIPQNQCYLVVDDQGDFVTNKGIVKTGITNFKSLDEVMEIPGCVPAWRDGFDGILYDNDNCLRKFKIEDDKVVLY